MPLILSFGLRRFFTGLRKSFTILFVLPGNGRDNFYITFKSYIEKSVKRRYYEKEKSCGIHQSIDQ